MSQIVKVIRSKETYLGIEVIVKVGPLFLGKILITLRQSLFKKVAKNSDFNGKIVEVKTFNKSDL